MLQFCFSCYSDDLGALLEIRGTGSNFHQLHLISRERRDIILQAIGAGISLGDPIMGLPLVGSKKPRRRRRKNG